MTDVQLRKSQAMGRALSRLLDLAASVFLAISIGCLAAIMLLITVDIFLRNVLNFPLPITIPYVEILLAGAVAGAVTYTQSINGHVAADILTARLPVAVARWTKFVGMLVAALALATIAYTTSGIAISSFLDGETRPGLVPVEFWPGRALIASAFVVLTLLVVRHLFRELKQPSEDTGRSEDTTRTEE